MFTIQPTRLLRYLTFHRSTLASGLRQFFYASWEDALWDVLKNKNVGAADVLVPDFFCIDVIENMQRHGLQSHFYQIDENFQPVESEFRKMLQLVKPRIVVIFHAVGIENQLLKHFHEWKHLIVAETVIIEDCVHRIVDPEAITLVTPNHVVIDSLRKVVPLMGARLFAASEFLSYNQNKKISRNYQWQIIRLWLEFQYCLSRASFAKSLTSNTKWNMKAERKMIEGYEVIGDSTDAEPGWHLFSFLADHLDTKKISKVKQRQANIYTTLLATLHSSDSFHCITLSPESQGKLRAFPIILENRIASTVLGQIRDAGVLVRFELEGCPWSVKQKVLYLPLGPHLPDADIHWAGNCVVEALRASTQ